MESRLGFEALKDLPGGNVALHEEHEDENRQWALWRTGEFEGPLTSAGVYYFAAKGRHKPTGRGATRPHFSAYYDVPVGAGWRCVVVQLLGWFLRFDLNENKYVHEVAFQVSGQLRHPDKVRIFVGGVLEDRDDPHPFNWEARVGIFLMR